ncbi:MAG: hypothetical protein WC870_02750 [Candidatus Paceibacterota bacterium]
MEVKMVPKEEGWVVLINIVKAVVVVILLLLAWFLATKEKSSQG